MHTHPPTDDLVPSGAPEAPPGTEYVRRCRRCDGPVFHPIRKPGRKPEFCSDACRVADREERLREQGVKSPAPAVRPCAHCGTEFNGKGTSAKFCSVTCRNDATHERYREERAQARPGRPTRRRFAENPKWQRPAAESQRLALRWTLEGRLRRIDQAVYARGRN